MKVDIEEWFSKYDKDLVRDDVKSGVAKKIANLNRLFDFMKKFM